MSTVINKLVSSVLQRLKSHTGGKPVWGLTGVRGQGTGTAIKAQHGYLVKMGTGGQLGQYAGGVKVRHCHCHCGAITMCGEQWYHT